MPTYAEEHGMVETACLCGYELAGVACAYRTTKMSSLSHMVCLHPEIKGLTDDEASKIVDGVCPLIVEWEKNRAEQRREWAEQYAKAHPEVA